MRAKGRRSSDEAPSFGEEPSWGVLATLCVVMNIATPNDRPLAEHLVDGCGDEG